MLIEIVAMLRLYISQWITFSHDYEIYNVKDQAFGVVKYSKIPSHMNESTTIVIVIQTRASKENPFSWFVLRVS